MSSNNPSISDQVRFSDAEKRILSAFENDSDVYDFIQWFTIGADLTVEEYEEEVERLERQLDRASSELYELDEEISILRDKFNDEIKRSEQLSNENTILQLEVKRLKRKEE